MTKEGLVHYRESQISPVQEPSAGAHPVGENSGGEGLPSAWQQSFLEAGPFDVSVCIANWNGREMLCRCLESLQDVPQGVRLETIVVDNASADGAADMVARDFPEVILIRNQANLGFSRANNQAAALARGRYLFFLNNDTLVPQGTLSRLVRYADRCPSLGILGPRLRDGRGRIQISCRKRPNLATLLHRTALFRWTGFLKTAYQRYRRESFDPDTVCRPDVLMGAAMLVPRAVFLSSGGWDDDFTFGGEDLEFSLRIGRTHDLVYCPDAEIIHFGRVSTRAHVGWASSQIAVGFLRYLRKCGYGWTSILFYKFVVTFDTPVQFISKAVQGVWRRLAGKREKASKSFLAMRGYGHLLFRGLGQFWKA